MDASCRVVVVSGIFELFRSFHCRSFSFSFARGGGYYINLGCNRHPTVLRQLPYLQMSTKTNTNISTGVARVSPIIVTSNSEPGSDACIMDAHPGAVLLPDATLIAGPVRPMGKKKLSMLQELRHGKKVVAMFESPLMDVVYPIQVKESKFAAGAAGGGGGATSVNFVEAAAANDPLSTASIPVGASAALAANTAASIATAAAATTTTAPTNGSNSMRTHWCNAVLRCSDEHSLAAMTLLDSKIDQSFPASIGFNGPRKMQSDSILFASKDDPANSNLVKLDVPFDTNTLALNVNAVDENGEEMHAIDVIPANSRIKAIFVVEMTRTDQPARLFSRLTLISVAIVESSSGFQQLRENCFFQTIPSAMKRAAPEETTTALLPSSSSSSSDSPSKKKIKTEDDDGNNSTGVHSESPSD